MHETKQLELIALNHALDNLATRPPCGINRRPDLIPGITCDFSNDVEYDYDDYTFLPENDRSGFQYVNIIRLQNHICCFHIMLY